MAAPIHWVIIVFSSGCVFAWLLAQLLLLVGIIARYSRLVLLLHLLLVWCSEVDSDGVQEQFPNVVCLLSFDKLCRILLMLLMSILTRCRVLLPSSS